MSANGTLLCAENRRPKMISSLLCLLALACWPVYGQIQQTPGKTILAVGAHAGDMEVTAGALLAAQSRAGDRIVLLHLTLGEGGNPRLSTEQYAKQKRQEAGAAAEAIRAEVIFGPYKDGELPNNEEARRYVAGIIRRIKPAYVLTHWKSGLHRDHIATHAIVTDAVLLASLPNAPQGETPHRGVRSVWFTENWEDKENFNPYICVDVSKGVDDWEKGATQYEFIRGGISKFPYLEYYKALFKVRGAESGVDLAECFDVESWRKKQIYRSLP
jgi:LmbE family N-acetylglucosaminyl deacetylase